MKLIFRAIIITGLCAGGVNPVFAQSTDSAEQSVSANERMLGANDAAAKEAVTVDLAFGAFQRGHYLTAFELALPRANLGDPAAQTLIAELYEKGLGVARDQKESTAWYGIAAKAGNLEAQFAYAVKLLEGKYIKPNAKEARQMMQNAADAGHASASFNFGQLLVEERPTSEGIKQALPYFETAAKARIADAYYMLSQVYRSGKLNGFPQYDEAQEWLFKAAKAGVDTAQVELAIWLMQGKAGIKDDNVAYLWMRRAAIGGNVVGQNRLAKMLLEGIGVERNQIEGIKWYIIAKRAGLNDRQLEAQLGTLNQSDLAKALEAANKWPSG